MLEKEIMISINPPYANMILSGYKSMEFRRAILNIMKEYDACVLYIYETKNKGGCGKIIGRAELYAVYEVYYSNQITENISRNVTLQRYNCIKRLYLNWCEKHNIKPNMNEGWFKSKKFKKYIEDIGWKFPQDFNYALELSNIQKYDKPKILSDFLTPAGTKMVRPPQNMCECRTSQETN